MRYRITCTTEDRQRFVLAGIFPNDWAAIEFAISQGAALAIPHRV
jgi:hypothetical protein